MALTVLLAVLLLLVFWWNPTPGTSRVVPSLMLIVLAAAGVEALRRDAIRDFPDETMPVASERWRNRLDGFLARVRGTRSRPAREAGSPGEERIATIERLARLRDSGRSPPRSSSARRR